MPSRWSPSGWYPSHRRLIHPSSPTMKFFKRSRLPAKHRSDSIPNTTECRAQYQDRLSEVRKSTEVKLPGLRRSLDLDKSRYCEVTLAGVLGTPSCVQRRGYLLYHGSPLPVAMHSFGRKRDELSVWGDAMVTKGIVTKRFVFS